jgi:hypothetical protein
MQINNIEELIDFVNRKEVSYQNAEKVVNTCFSIVTVSFRDFDPEKDTKEALIKKINGTYQTDVFIHWED